MDLRYHLLDVFTDVAFGGNQLAVFVDAPDLDTPLMQRIARELNLSETVFVRPPRDTRAARRLRIFTPAVELPFAGHPTIGTAFLLADLGEVKADGDRAAFALEEEVGLVPVTVTRSRTGGLSFAELTAARVPEAGPAPPPPAVLARVIGVDESDILTGEDAPQAVSAGVPFLFVPLRSREAVGRAWIDLGAWKAELAGEWANKVYVFCREPERPGADVRARMFAPSVGVMEDPATGSAAAAFAGYLAWRSKAGDGTLTWTVEQGVEMGRPSVLRLQADISGGVVQAVRVGGTSVRMGQGTLTIE